MTLAELIDTHDVRRIDGHEVYSRWVVLSADNASPSMFGDCHRVTDFLLCGALPREHGMVFMFQRNAKPTRKEGE